MSEPDAPIRALVVSDSTTEYGRLATALAADGDIAVVGHARTGPQTLTLIAGTRPDVVVLNLPDAEETGQHTIEQIMARMPTPTLVLSRRIDDRGCPAAVEALVAGALEALPLPPQWTSAPAAELRRTVRQIRKIRVIRHPRGRLNGTVRADTAPSVDARPLVAVAASTGGPSALATLLGGLGGLDAPVLVVQHLHAEFTNGLVEWMSRVSALPVETAEDGTLPRAGRVYFAPGGVHLRVDRGHRLVLDPVPASTHRPSADQLFRSVADNVGAAAVGVLLTGMGDDGARGLLTIHQHAGQTIAQDEASSAVFGMPQAAYRIGAVTELLPLDRIAWAVRQAVRRVRS